MLRSTGYPELVAACSCAIILRECAGLTRPSVDSGLHEDGRIGGAFTTVMVGRIRYNALNCCGSFTVPNSVVLNEPFGSSSTRSMS